MNKKNIRDEYWGGGEMQAVEEVEALKFTEWFKQWQRLVLSGRDGQQHVMYQETNGNTLIEIKY